jgi:hypothetical protein
MQLGHVHTQVAMGGHARGPDYAEEACEVEPKTPSSEYAVSPNITRAMKQQSRGWSDVRNYNSKKEKIAEDSILSAAHHQLAIPRSREAFGKPTEALSFGKKSEISGRGGCPWPDTGIETCFRLRARKGTIGGALT